MKRWYACNELLKSLWIDKRYGKETQPFNFEEFFWWKNHWEFWYLDNICYQNSLERFTWKQIARIVELANGIRYYYTTDSIKLLFASKIIEDALLNDSFKRILYMHLYLSHLQNIGIDYKKTKAVFKELFNSIN